MRILADANMADVANMFSGLGDVVLMPGREMGRADLVNTELLLVRSVTRVDAALLEGSPVRFVGTATSGFDHVDRAYLQQHNIGFAFAPGSNANSVVEYILSVIAHDGQRLESLRAGASLGIIGYGVVGRLLHRRLATLGISCRAYDPWLPQDEHDDLVSLEQVLDCDVISLHAELTDRRPHPSRHLLNAEALSRIAGKCLLINAGRGPLIDNAALLAQLREMPSWRVALDVWEFEPEVDPELMAACFIVSPHIAGYSHDGKLLATRMLLEAVCEQLDVAAPPQNTSLEIVDVNVPPGLKGAGLLRWLLAQRYDVMDDDDLMRRELSRGFDTLRAEYRQRRELSSLSIGNVDALTAEQLSIIAALGCRADSRADNT